MRLNDKTVWLVKNKLLIAALLTVSINTQAKAQYNGKIPNTTYLEVGIGLSPFANSHIKGAAQRYPSPQGYLEVGRFFTNFSVVGGYDMGTYRFSSFRLNPNYTFLQLRYDFLFYTIPRGDVSIFAMGGLFHHQTAFEIRSQSGEASLSERKSGYGYQWGVGAKAERRRWSLTLVASTAQASATYSIGSFDPETYQVGSERITIAIGYKIKTSEFNVAKCQTYK